MGPTQGLKTGPCLLPNGFLSTVSAETIIHKIHNILESIDSFFMKHPSCCLTHLQDSLGG